MYHIDETGNKYGFLTVLGYSHTEKTHAFWLCRCVCGREKPINGQNLRRGQTSCGCAGGKKRPRDIPSGIDIGYKNNRLEVISQQFDYARHKLYWLCKCECGGQKLVETYDLLHGKVKSCGCLHRESAIATSKRFALPEGESAKNSLIHGYKKSAKSRGISYELNDKIAKKLLVSNCFYCGVAPECIFKVSEAGGILKYNGIDRKNNSKGYTRRNVVPCCKKCNRAKTIMGYKDFTTYLDRVASYRKDLYPI